jgi:hypothetical protein
VIAICIFRHNSTANSEIMFRNITASPAFATRQPLVPGKLGERVMEARHLTFMWRLAAFTMISGNKIVPDAEIRHIP